MSKKHFEQAAYAIREYVLEGKLNEANAAAVVFSTVAKMNNPAFDMARFKTACGLA